MTERKPPNVSFESWVDKQIRESMDRGEFDDLPGHGKPIPDLDKADDELWWIRRKMRREGVGTDAMLPTPLRLRKEIEDLPGVVRRLGTERAVRERVADLNRRILDWMRIPVGPQVIVVPVDVETVVDQWQATRPVQQADPATPPEPRTSWWDRMFGRRPPRRGRRASGG
jgi:hypothetical protein